jgi:hypothetical protein
MARANRKSTTKDPVFAEIDAHRVAAAALYAVSVEFSEVAPKCLHSRSGPELPEGLVDRMTDTDMAERQARRSLVDSRPATIEGAHALIAYLGTVIRDMDQRDW